MNERKERIKEGVLECTDCGSVGEVLPAVVVLAGISHLGGFRPAAAILPDRYERMLPIHVGALYIGLCIPCVSRLQSHCVDIHTFGAEPAEEKALHG